MSLVLSNAFKGLLLSSYVKVKYDLAVISLKDLINKPNVEIINTGSLNSIEKPCEVHEFCQLKDRIKENIIGPRKDDENLKKLEIGQAVVLADSYECRMFKICFSHLNLIFSDDHYFSQFQVLRISKSHSHSLKIYKL